MALSWCVTAMYGMGLARAASVHKAVEELPHLVHGGAHSGGEGDDGRGLGRPDGARREGLAVPALAGRERAQAGQQIEGGQVGDGRADATRGVLHELADGVGDDAVAVGGLAEPLWRGGWSWWEKARKKPLLFIAAVSGDR